MNPTPTKEGKVAFRIPNYPDLLCETYYKIFGDLSSGVPPLVILHGGPGVGHEYLLPIADLSSKHNNPRRLLRPCWMRCLNPSSTNGRKQGVLARAAFYCGAGEPLGSFGAVF